MDATAVDLVGKARRFCMIRRGLADYRIVVRAGRLLSGSDLAISGLRFYGHADTGMSGQTGKSQREAGQQDQQAV